MKAFLVVLLAALFLSGCGDTKITQVKVNHVPQEEIQELFNEEYGDTGDYALGFASWVSVDNVSICEIYVMDMEEYESEFEYHETLGHELRHCIEGQFHDDPI